jgi:hypothetical protein
MRRFVFAGAAVFLAGLAYFLVRREKTYTETNPPSRSSQSPDAAEIDPSEVFRRAFWQLPGENDKILQAERREWSDAEGVRRWQWFLVVEPSPELVKYLRTDNAFGLLPSTSFPAIENAPDWFAIRPEEFDVAQAPHGNMRLFFHKTRPLLHATSSGTGFRPGVTSPTQTKPSSTRPQTTSGRLPLHSPPKK